MTKELFDTSIEYLNRTIQQVDEQDPPTCCDRCCLNHGCSNAAILNRMRRMASVLVRAIQEVNTSMPHRNLHWRLHSEANGHPRKENGFDDCMGFHIIIEYSLPPAQQPQRPVSSAMDGGARPPTRAPATSEPIDAETLARAIALVQEQRRAERQPLLS